MDLWIANLFPGKFLEILPAVSLILIGIAVEREYTGRISIFSNAVALTTYFYKFQNLPVLLVWYINILTVFGVISFFILFVR